MRGEGVERCRGARRRRGRASGVRGGGCAVHAPGRPRDDELAAAAAAPPSAPSAPRLNPGRIRSRRRTSAARVQPTGTTKRRSRSATRASARSCIPGHVPALADHRGVPRAKGTTRRPRVPFQTTPATYDERGAVARVGCRARGVPGVTEPRADPVGDHVSPRPSPRAFDEFVKRRHGDGRASSIVAAAAERVRPGESSRGGGASGVLSGGARGARGRRPPSPAPPPSARRRSAA